MPVISTIRLGAAKAQPRQPQPGVWRLAVVVAALCLAGCATTPPAALPPAVQAALDRAGLPPTALGVVAYPLAQPALGLRLRAEEAMQPGSAMKLVTAIVALEQLGPTARGRTELLADTALQGDVLPGALYLRGGADSELDWGVLWDLLRQLREQGVREIRGGLVVDRTLFNPTRVDLGVPPFDEAPEFPYNSLPDALNLNEGRIELTLRTSATQLSAQASPLLAGITLDTSAVQLNGKACADWEDDWQTPQVTSEAQGWRIRLRGPFPRNCVQRASFNLIDRHWLTVQAVRQFWRDLGGSFASVGSSGGINAVDREAATPATARVLASHRGRRLGEVLYGAMKSSDNLATRLIYLRLGVVAANPGEPTLAASDRVVRAWLRSAGIADDGLVLDNGSGLSRSERIQPVQMAAVLAQALRSRYASEFVSGLPLAGVDGTLSRRLKGAAAEGRARLKTGTLRDAVALAGYVNDAAERQWILVAFLNHPDAAEKGRPVLDTIAEWVAAQR